MHKNGIAAGVMIQPWPATRHAAVTRPALERTRICLVRVVCSNSSRQAKAARSGPALACASAGVLLAACDRI